MTPRGKKELSRIPFLARARNRVLEPLFELRPERGRNGSFDRLLFLLFAYPQFAKYAGCKLICEGMTGRRRIKSTKHPQR